MSDGSVKIDVIVDDKDTKTLENRIDNLEKKINKGFTPMKSPFDNPVKGADEITKAILGSKGVVYALNLVQSSVGSAVSRFDTMKQFPRMMEQLGFSANESQISIKKLSSGIEGLPTRLDEIVAVTQDLTSTTGDLSYSTDLALALNDAFLSSGSSAQDASRGLLQFKQMLAKGKVDQQSWNTLLETMGLSIQQVAESFGFAGDSAKTDFYEALKSGRITFKQFSDKLVEMDKGLNGFASTAQTGSAGIATSWQNVKTAVVNGLASVIQTIDDSLNKITGKGISGMLDNLKSIVKSTFSSINVAAKIAGGVLGGLVKVFEVLANVLTPLAPVINGVVIALAGLAIVKKISGGLETLAIKALYAGDAIKAMIASTNPISLAVVAISALGTALGVGLHSALKNVQTEATITMNKVSELKKATKELTEETKESEVEWNNLRKGWERSQQKTKTLATRIKELSSKTKLSKKEAEELKTLIGQLNGEIGKEILKYNEKKKAVEGNISVLDDYIKHSNAQKKIKDIIDNEAKAQDEHRKAVEKHNEAIKLKAELQQKVNETTHEGDIGTNQYAISLSNVIEQEKALAEQVNITGEAVKQAEADKQQAYQESADSAEKVKQAETELQEAMTGKTITMEELNEREKPVVEEMKERYNGIKESATDMFDRLNTKSELTGKQMIENIKHNAEAVSEWAENLKSLSDKGVNEGLLENLRQMGPKGAGYVKELNNLSKEELDELNEAYEKAGEDSMSSLAKSMNIEETDIPDSISTLITDIDSSLTSQFEGIDWSQYGTNISDGLAGGVETGKEKVKQVTEGMATGQKEAFTNAMDINSPSGVFETYGGFIVDGLVNGINKGVDRVKTSITKLSGQLKGITKVDFSSFSDSTSNTMALVLKTVSDSITKITSMTKTGMANINNNLKAGLSKVISDTRINIRTLVRIFNIKNNLTVLGRQAGQGFRYGLASARNGIVNTARSIANQISNTIRKALQIHSPSRVMMKIGEQTGEGFEIGLKDKVDDVKKQAELLSEASLPKVNKAKLFNVGVNAQVADNTNKGSTHSNNSDTPIIFNIDKIVWNGKEDIRKTMSEMGWIAGRENWRLET